MDLRRWAMPYVRRPLRVLKCSRAARAAGTGAAWVGMPMLVVVLAGGFAVNAVWCLWQNAKNKSFGDYRRGALPWLLSGVAGATWAMQFVCQKIGEPALGEIRYISFALVMGSIDAPTRSRPMPSPTALHLVGRLSLLPFYRP